MRGRTTAPPLTGQEYCVGILKTQTCPQQQLYQVKSFTADISQYANRLHYYRHRTLTIMPLAVVMVFQ